MLGRTLAFLVQNIPARDDFVGFLKTYKLKSSRSLTGRTWPPSGAAVACRHAVRNLLQLGRDRITLPSRSPSRSAWIYSIKPIALVRSSVFSRASRSTNVGESFIEECRPGHLRRNCIHLVISSHQNDETFISPCHIASRPELCRGRYAPELMLCLVAGFVRSRACPKYREHSSEVCGPCQVCDGAETFHPAPERIAGRGGKAALSERVRARLSREPRPCVDAR